MYITKYVLQVQLGNLLPPSYRKPSFLPDGNKLESTSFSGLLMERAIDRASKHVPKLKAMISLRPDLLVTAQVCQLCFSYKIISSESPSQDAYTENHHACDPSWLLDHPDVEEKKELVIGLLETKIPVCLTELAKSIRGGGAINLVAIRNEHASDELPPNTVKTATDEIRKRVNKDLEDLNVVPIVPPPVGTKRKGKYLLDERYGPIAFILKGDYPWIRRVCEKGIINISPDELEQFFAILPRTAYHVDIDGERYYFRLLLNEIGIPKRKIFPP